MIPAQNKLDIYIPLDDDMDAIAEAIRRHLLRCQGARLYAFSALVGDELNLIGHAPREVIEGLATAAEVLGFRLIDHTSEVEP